MQKILSAQEKEDYIKEVNRKMKQTTLLFEFYCSLPEEQEERKNAEMARIKDFSVAEEINSSIGIHRELNKQLHKNKKKLLKLKDTIKANLEQYNPNIIQFDIIGDISNAESCYCDTALTNDLLKFLFENIDLKNKILIINNVTCTGYEKCENVPQEHLGFSSRYQYVQYNPDCVSYLSTELLNILKEQNNIPKSLYYCNLDEDIGNKSSPNQYFKLDSRFIKNYDIKKTNLPKSIAIRDRHGYHNVSNMYDFKNQINKDLHEIAIKSFLNKKEGIIPPIKNAVKKGKCEMHDGVYLFDKDNLKVNFIPNKDFENKIPKWQLDIETCCFAYF